MKAARIVRRKTCVSAIDLDINIHVRKRR
jgi:hypothetical protein